MEVNYFKSLFFEQVARIGKALSNPKRLEIIELLCQGEKSVDIISQQTRINIKLASSHLQDERRNCRLASCRIAYRSIN